MLAARVLLVAYQDLVARLEVEAVRDVAVGLGRVAHEGQLVARAADELRERIPELVPRSVAPDRVVLGIGLGHALGLAVALEDRAQDGPGAGAHGAVVQEHLVRGDEELLADLGPVGLFVAKVEVARRQGGRGRSVFGAETRDGQQGGGGAPGVGEARV